MDGTIREINTSLSLRGTLKARNDTLRTSVIDIQCGYGGLTALLTIGEPIETSSVRFRFDTLPAQSMDQSIWLNMGQLLMSRDEASAWKFAESLRGKSLLMVEYASENQQALNLARFNTSGIDQYLSALGASCPKPAKA